MNFKPELAEKVMAGEKTVTRRLVSSNARSPWAYNGCKLKLGRDYAVCPGRGKNAIGRVRITSLLLVQLGHLDGKEAQREGFETPAEFESVFAGINGRYNPKAWVWRVEFEVSA